MKTILRILKGKNIGYHVFPQLNISPKKGDNVVFKEETYTVSSVEYDFNELTHYIIVI